LHPEPAIPRFEGNDNAFFRRGRWYDETSINTKLARKTRREIDMRLRVARRELTEHAAQLAINVAEERIKRSITPDDQLRLVDRYTAQLQEAR